MSVTTEILNRAITAARNLEQQGYFEKVRQGNQKAASLFARLTAFMLNPDGDEEDFGCLTKSPGETQVDGFAEDAIVYGNDPDERENVIDLVNGAGAPGASIGGAIKPRREHNRWLKPLPLTDAELRFLRPSGEPPKPPQPPPVQHPVPPRDEALDEMNALDRYYSSQEGLQRQNGLSLNGKPDFEGIAAWYLDVYQNERLKGKSRADARAAYVNQIRNSGEWKAKHPGETP